MKFKYKEQEYYIDGWLASAADSLIYNIKKDHDFVVLITGDRGVRVGKSVLGMTFCAYLASRLAKVKKDGKPLNKDAYGLDNIFFDNKVMMDRAQKLPKYSIVHYDEGREGMAANKAMKSFQQDLMDFFAECGQLNLIFVICCPDFFELKETMAVARSEYLINVYRKEVGIETDMYKEGKISVVRLDRGFFEFFNKKKKRQLYDMAKSMRRKVYSLVKPNFIGRFTLQFTEGEEEYKQKKKDSLSRFKERHEEQAKDKYYPMFYHFVKYHMSLGMKTPEIKEKSELMLGKEYSDRWYNKIQQEIRDKEPLIGTKGGVSPFEKEAGHAYTNKLTEKEVNVDELG